MNQNNDLISRQAAIDCVTYDVEHTVECLKALPSAQPERKKGKWIPWKFHNGFRCENCNEPVDNKYNFCPNCGADMRGKQDDR